jgi:hypothetical protein
MSRKTWQGSASDRGTIESASDAAAIPIPPSD